MKSSQKLGGHGLTVEIDEAKFWKSKYHRGRYVKGQWVFGGVERGSNKTFLVPVEKRDAATLLDILQKWVLPNTIIISDCWKAYQGIPDKTLFYHFTVNHSINFVDPETGAHTNSIERTWRDVRSTIPRYGVRKAHFVGYLAEYQFKRRYERGERLHHFFKAAAALYPPKPLQN
jgi:transposase-like protein